MASSTVGQTYYGPVKWEDAGPPHIYDSGTPLHPFNEGLHLPTGLLRMSVARVGPGQDVDHHDHHTMSEIYYLMEGKSHYRVDDELIEVEENTAMFFHPGVMRSVVNNSDKIAWWLFVGSPPEVHPGQTQPPEMEGIQVPPAPEQKAFGPIKWEDAGPAHIYDSGTPLHPFNEGLHLNTGLLRMSVARVGPGQDVDHHDHNTMSEVYFLMRGKGQFRVDNQLIDAEEHTAMFFHPGVMRSVVNNSNEDAWWLFVGSPPEQ